MARAKAKATTTTKTAPTIDGGGVVGNTTETRNARWANDDSSFGRRMLMKMGWKQGDGLGSSKSGITTHVKTTKRLDAALGIGAIETDTFGANGWSDTTQDYHAVLTQLKKEYATSTNKKTKKRKRKRSVVEKEQDTEDGNDDNSDDDSDKDGDDDDDDDVKKKEEGVDDDEEREQPSDVADDEKKRRKNKKDKEERSKKRRRKDKSDQPKKDKKKKKTGLTLAKNRVLAGHARKMREAKDLSNKSAKDLAAIFGVPPPL